MAKKKAVLIGINYPGTDDELRGCVNDVWRMHRCLVDRYGFSDGDITVMIDTDDKYLQPTGKNIRKELTDLVGSAEAGDLLVVHYSGHGTRLPAETGEEDDTGYDECLVPSDANLISDDEIRDIVVQLPEGCRFTMISDSCHSGGLIRGAKEQIGESTREGKERSRSLDFALRSLLCEPLRSAFASCGILLPLQLQSSGSGTEERQDEVETREIKVEDGERVHVKSKSLPLPSLIKLLKQKTGKEDIDIGNLRPTLYDIFGEDSTPKVKKFMKVILDKLQSGEYESAGGAILGMIGSLAHEFLKQKLENNAEYMKPMLQTQVSDKREAFAGAVAQRALPTSVILISGCQTDQTSADATPEDEPDKAYGAFSNAVQIILRETDDGITNYKLVTSARQLLKKQGFTQRPGLYCSDRSTNEKFIC